MIFDNELSHWNWSTKYRYKNEHPLQTFVRTAIAVADVNHTHYGEDKTVSRKLADDFVKLMVKMVPAPQDAQPYINLGTSLDLEFDSKSEVYYEDIYGAKFIPIGLKFTPGGRITANAGTEFAGATLLNCFIAGPVKSAKVSYSIPHPILDKLLVEYESEDTADNLLNIFLTIAEQAETLKSEGGYGINFGFIRPRSTLIDGVGVRHPGAVSYMEIWDKVSEVIVRGDSDGYQDKIVNHLGAKQSKKKNEKKQIRKGAMMAVLPVWHPDIEEFITAKRTAGKLTKFNCSVGVDDAFIEAVINDTHYNLEFKGVVHKVVAAKDLYNLIMESTYNFAEPGVLYIDNMNRNNPLIHIAPVSATNPCGEIGGASYFDSEKKYADFLQVWIDKYKEQGEEIGGMSTVCLLGSLNLPMYVMENRSFDFEQYEEDVLTAALFLENINDIGNTPLPHYQRALTDVRQYGMGVNGLGSALVMMGVKYGSQEAIAFTKEVSEIKQNLAWQQSALLAKQRGPAPAYTEDFLKTEWFNNSKISQEVKDLIVQYGVRNMKTTTNPPLGNSSVISNNVSNSGEPLSFTEYDRTSICPEWPEGLTLDNVKQLFREKKQGEDIVWAGEYGGKRYLFEPSNRGLCEINTVYDYGYKWVKERFPEELSADYIVDSTSLSVEAHLYMQAAMQDYVDQSISKTIIVPHDYPFEDFKKTYLLAHKLGLNGCTTYRVGTLGAVISQTESDDAPQMSKVDLLKQCGAIEEGAHILDSGVIPNHVHLPETYVMDNMVVVKREGNKYYMTFSFLPNDHDKVHPIAFWILTNSFKSGEYVSMRRAINALYALMQTEGIDPQLISQHEGKVGSDVWVSKLGKAISMCLRHNVPLKSIVEAMEGIEGDHIATTLTAVRKFLKAKINDGTRTGKTCLACGSLNVVYEAGCDKCLDCGSTGCN